MDSAKTVDCVEWCFGYGGNHIGIKSVVPSLRCIAACEIEAYADANLVSKMEGGFLEPFPVWTNVKSFPCEIFRGLVDIFIASYPCQPFSSAGRRKGHTDKRHLWPYVRRAVATIRPAICFFENVEGHVSLGLREVLTELALLGYRVENGRGEPAFGIFSAAEIGAPHNRRRVFILAVRHGVVQDDAMFEQDLGKHAGGFHGGIVRTSELADAQRPGNGTVSTRPGNQRIGTGEPDGPGEELGDSAIVRRESVCQDGGETSGSDDARQDSGLRESSGTGSQSGNESHTVGLADRVCSRCGEGDSDGGGSREGTPSAKERSGLADCGRGDGLAVAAGEGRERRGIRGHIAKHGSKFWPGVVSRPGAEQHGWEPPRVTVTKRGLGGGVNGRSANVDRLRLLGNGVYPEAVARAFATLYLRMMDK